MELHPQDRRFWVEPAMIQTDRKGLPEPAWTVHDVSRFFFNRSSSWLRLRMRTSPDHPLTWMVLDGKPMEIMRKYPEDPESARLFTLADIEPMAHSMHGFDVADVMAERKELNRSHPQELSALLARQARIVGNLPITSRQRGRLAGSHANQQQALKDKHDRQRKSLDDREAALERQLHATVSIVRAVAVLYGILGEDGNPVPRP